MWWIQSLPCKNRETCFGRTIWPIFCADKFVDENTYTFDRWSCARRSIADVQGTSGKALTTEPSDQNLYWCRIADNSWSRTVFHDERTLQSSHNLQNQWHVVSTLCQEMKNHLNQKVGTEGKPKLDPHWKLQLVAYKVNMEWKLELSL